MLTACTLRRAALLSLTVLCACAAGEPQSRPPAVRDADMLEPTGRFGAFLEGQFAIATQDLPFAADRLMAVIAADPTNIPLKNQALLAAILANRADAARLAAQLPANPIARLLLANRDAAAGNWAAAEAAYRNLPRDGSTDLLQPLLVAWAQQGAGHTDEAQATLRRLTNGQRVSGLYALHAALIADQANRAAEADRLYAIAAADEPGGNLRMGQILASWTARRGNLPEAARILQERVGVSPPLAIAMPALRVQIASVAVHNAREGLAETYLAIAAGLHQQHTEDFAQILLQFALDLRPDLTAARLLLSDIQGASGRPAAAMATLTPVGHDDPLASVARLRRDAFAADAKQPDEAAADLRQMAIAMPSRPEPLAELGDILRGQERFHEAAAAYTGAINRDAPSASAWRLFFQRGISYERAHDWVHAEADLERAVELAPDQPSVLNYLGYAWADRGQHLDRARQMLERAAQLQPNDGAIIDSLGWVQLRQGDAAHAVRTLEHAAELEPEDPTITGHLGDAYWELGRRIEAEDQWRRALVLKPDPDDAARIAARLKQASK
jgi:tetratricopeptide (TPR) repeat protein